MTKRTLEEIMQGRLIIDAKVCIKHTTGLGTEYETMYTPITKLAEGLTANQNNQIINLINAAPDLLKACKQLAEMLKDSSLSTFVKDAIKKAEGK